MYQRDLRIESGETFFLWGPRQTGKSTLLRQSFPGSFTIDLLKSDDFRTYKSEPERLRELLGAMPAVNFVVIDEIQKVPELLDEVHWLIENKALKFGLCGSSARKLRRGHANLLGGRAVRYELFGLTAHELGGDFDLVELLNRGYLPRHFASARYEHLLRSYISDYLKEEIAAEALVRKLPSFTAFLAAAALGDGEMVNFSTISRDCGVSLDTVKNYFDILEDSLLASFLPSYQKRPKRRVIKAPKFYFSDVGVVNHLAKRSRIEPGSELFGKAFENWVFHELRAYNNYRQHFFDLSYWRLASKIEVDFIIGDMASAVEAKASKNIQSDHLKGLRALKEDHPEVGQRIVVSIEKNSRLTQDGILILSTQDFVDRLWRNELLAPAKES